MLIMQRFYKIRVPLCRRHGQQLATEWLLKTLVQEAHSRQMAAVVVTFFPHPDQILRGITGRYYIVTSDERARLLSELGVDVVITHPFDETVRQIRAAAFIDLLTSFDYRPQLRAEPA
jgi:riboflavin kinase/FMN adenylyltransferase